MTDPIIFVRVNFNDGSYVSTDHGRKTPLTRVEADILKDKYQRLMGKLVIAVERTDTIDGEYETYGYNLKGDCIIEYRRES